MSEIIDSTAIGSIIAGKHIIGKAAFVKSTLDTVHTPHTAPEITELLITGKNAGPATTITVVIAKFFTR